MAYNTGNPVGSTDPRDLSDNSENFDRAVNATGFTWVDRFGNVRTSLRGQVGYVGTGVDGAIEDYAPGQVLSGYNVIIRYSGEFYRASASATLPYTTTATLPDVDSNLVAVGDAVLRQDLALDPADGLGAAIVKGSTIYVPTVADLSSLPAEIGLQALVSGVPFSYTGASWEPSEGYVTPFCFGAIGDGVTDDRLPIQDAIDYISSGQKLLFPGGYDFRIVNATGSGATIEDRRADAVLNDTLFAITSVDNSIKIEIQGIISGTSPLDDIIRLSGDDVSIYGSGVIRNTSGEFLDTNSSDPLLQWSPSNLRIEGDNCTVSGLEIVDQPTSGILDAGNNNLITGCKFNGGPLVHGPGTRQFGVEQTVSGTIRKGGVVTNCRFYPSASGGACYSGVFSVCQNARITNNYFDLLLEHGVYANAVENIISGNTFKEIDLASAIQSFNGGTITENRFVNCAFGQIQVQRPNRTIISGNVATGAGLSGIAVRAGTGDASSVVYTDLEISGNIIDFNGTQSAIDIALVSSINGVKVTNNTVRNSAGSSVYGPIRVEVTASADFPGENIEFSGNTVNGSEIYGLYLKRFLTGKVCANTFIDCNRSLSITAARLFDCENIEFKNNTAVNDLSSTTSQILFAGGGVGDNNLNIQAFGNNGVNLAAGTSPLCGVPVPCVAMKNGRDSFGSEGFFTAANLSSDTINTGAATSCKPSAEVLLTPLNATAETIQVGAQRISATVKNDGSFVWATNSGSPIGTASASYKYEIIDN